MTTADRARAYLAACPGSPEGGRDDRTFEVACALVERFDLPDETLRDLLVEWNQAQHSPPLPARTVTAKLTSARKTTSYDPAKANDHGAQRASRPQEAHRPRPAPPEPPVAPLPSEAELSIARDRLATDTSSAAKAARKFLADGGIDPAACGWGLARLEPEEAGAVFGLPAAAAGWRLLIPVVLPDGALGDVRRYRFGNSGDQGTKVLPWAKGHGSAKPYGWHPRPDDGAELIWCEGEKDREALAAAGFAAVTNTCGAGSADNVAAALPAELVTGRRFVLLFDHDQAGREAAAKLAATLTARAATVRVAAWPDTLPDGRDTPAGFDAADWFRAGFTPAALQSLVLDQAVPVAPQKAAGGHAMTDPDPHAPALHDADEDQLGRRYCKPGTHQMTDVGNGKRLVDMAGDRLRWCVDWDQWLAYDGTRWKRDPGGIRARALAKLVAQSIAREALAAPEHQRAGLLKWAGTSQAQGKVSAMLWMAQSDLTVESTELDTDAYLLNCPNGTIDLRTGAVRPHDPADLITRCTRAAYVPGAECAQTPGADDWRRFLADTTAEDEELAGYLQRAAGYSVTGDPCEEVFFFAYGVERTGKSTFLATIAHHLADYADQADFTAFLKKRDDSELRPELAKLQGKRFVASSETSAGRALAEGLVKTITGNEPISTAAKYKDPVTWVPAFTLWLAANDRPNVRHDDGALWRRIKVVPFLHQVPEAAKDDGLKKRLRDTAGEAVIAWLVRGCLAWQTEGLGTCAAVGEATAEYREEMDPIGGWLAERCDVRPEQDWFTPTADLYRNFRQWAQSTNDRADLSQKQLGELLAKRGLNRTQRRVGSKRAHGYLGIRLTEQPEFGFDDDPHDPDLAESSLECHGCKPANEACVTGVTGNSHNFPDSISHKELSDNTRDTRDTRDTPASDSPDFDPEQDW